MLGNLSFESTANSFNVDEPLEVQSYHSQFEYESNTGLTFTTETEVSNVLMPNSGRSFSVATQETRLFESPFSVTTSEVNLESNGLKMVEQSNSLDWNGNSISTSVSQVDAGLFQSEISQTNAFIASEMPTELPSPGGINMVSSQFVFDSPLGSLVLNRETFSVGGTTETLSTPGMQSTTTEWSYSPEIGGMKLGGTISTVEVAPQAQASIQPGGCLENSWMQNVVETSISLDFGAFPANPIGNKLGGLTSTQSRTAVQMGPGQLTLESQTIDMFSRFAGPNLAVNWLSQKQTVADMSLAIA